MSLRVNSCRNPSIWQQRGLRQPPGSQKLHEQGVINCSNPLTPTPHQLAHSLSLKSFQLDVQQDGRNRQHDKVKGSSCLITQRRVPELIPVLCSQPAGDVSHKPGGRLPLLSARPAVTPATLKSAATSFAAWRTEAQWV